MEKIAAVWQDRKKRLTALLIIAAVVFIAGAYVFQLRKDMTDFGVCYKAGQRILKGESLYRQADGHLQHKYSPVSALFYAPLTFLPYEAAKAVWFALQFLFLPAVFILSYRMLPVKRKKAGFVIGAAILIMGKFLGRELELGQVNLFIIFILVLMMTAFFDRQDLRSGALWGLSILFKPYALVFLPYFILKKRFKILASGMAVLATGLFLPTVFYGFKGNLAVLREWPATLSVSTPPLLDVYDNASIFGFIFKTFPGSKDTWGLIAVAALLTAMGIAVLWIIETGRRSALPRPEALEFSLLMVLIPLFSPLGWYYNYLYAAPAVVLLLNEFGQFPAGLKYALVADFFFIGGTLREVLRKKLFRLYTRTALVAVNCLLLVFFLFYLRIKKRA